VIPKKLIFMTINFRMSNFSMMLSVDFARSYNDKYVWILTFPVWRAVRTINKDFFFFMETDGQ